MTRRRRYRYTGPHSPVDAPDMPPARRFREPQPSALFEFARTGYHYGFQNASPQPGAMRSKNGLRYAEHNLAPAQWRLNQLLRHPNKFDEGVWLKGASTVQKINKDTWAYTHNAGGNLSQLAISSPDGTFSVSVDLPKGGNAAWLQFQITDNAGTNRVNGWFDFAERKIGTTTVDGAGVVASLTFKKDRLRLAGSIDGASELLFWMRPVVANGSGTEAPNGTQFLVKKAMVSPGDVDLEWQDNEGVAALDNWSSPAFSAKLSLAYADGEVWWQLDNRGNGTTDWVQALGNDITVQVPHGLKALIWTVEGNGSYIGFAGGGPNAPDVAPGSKEYSTVIASPVSNPSRLQVTTRANALVRWKYVEVVEGQEFFGLPVYGAARYMARVAEGYALLHEPNVTQLCLNNTMAPTDTTNVVSERGASTTAFAIDDPAVPAWFIAGLAGIEGGENVRGVYRTRFASIGEAYVTGPTGNTNGHYVRTLMGHETGTALPAINLENAQVQIQAQAETLEWVGGAATPGSTADRLGISASSGEIWWTANMMHEGDTAHSHIPGNGSQRTRAADAPQKPADDAGLDLGRNSNKQTSVQGASVGGNGPDNWVLNNDGGLSWSVVGIDSDAIFMRLSGTASAAGPNMFPSQLNDTVAASGETWFGVFDAAIVAGDLANIDEISLRVSGRNDAGSQQEFSPLSIKNFLSDQQQTFSLSRSLNNVATTRATVQLQVDAASGPVDITFKIWCGEQTCWALQKSTRVERRLLTTGEAVVPFVSAYEGFTIVHETDLNTPPVDFTRLWVLAGSNEATDRIDVVCGSGATLSEPAASFYNDGTGNFINATGQSVVGAHVHQVAIKEGDQQFWFDQLNQGTSALELTSDVTTLTIGNAKALPRPSDGTTKRFTIYGSRLTGAV